MATNHVEYALRYWAMGWSVIPIQYRSKEKKPLLSWKAYQKRQPTEDEIKLWFGDYFRDPTYKEVQAWFDSWKTAPSADKIKEILQKEHNIALVTGKVSNRVVVDCDSPEAIELYYELGGDRTGPYCISQRGNQFHCGWAKGADLAAEKWPRGYSGREDLPNIDLRAQGNTAMIPWSVHWSGHKYEWKNTERINDLPEIPERLLIGDPKKGRSMVGANGQDGPKEKKNWSELWQGGGEGSRNKTLASLAGSWAAAGLPLPVAMQNGAVWNEKNDPPMEIPELETTIKSVYSKEEKRKEAKEEKKEAGDYVDSEFFPRTDQGNAEALVARHGKNMRYSPERKSWYVWDGCRWILARMRQVEQFAIDTVRALPEYAQASDDNVKEAVRVWSKKSESHKNVNAMITMAQAVNPMPTPMTLFDRNQFLVCCPNGIVDLWNKGAYRSHEREDFITRMTSVPYDPEAECPMWKHFLDEIFDWNGAIISYVQRVIGYCLTGSTAEQCMWILHGDGANGKSTFCNVIMWLLGEYARTAPRNVFLVKSGGDNHPAELAHLNGARMVLAEESEETSRLSEGLVKQATGSKTMAVRFMHENFWDMVLTYKILFMTNHKPDIRGAERGIWRRIKTIFFPKNFRITPENRNLDEKMFKAEASGILNWAIAGAMQWMEHGMREPDEVREELERYKEEMDYLWDFISDNCSIKDETWCNASDLYRAYTKWADVNGTWRYSHKRFAIHLAHKIKEKTGNIVMMGFYGPDDIRIYKGIALKGTQTTL